MRYHVTIGDRTFEVELDEDRYLVDGRPIDAELIRVPGTPLRHLRIGGRNHILTAERGEERGRWRLQLGGNSLEVEVLDERARAIQSMTRSVALAEGPRPIRAPMPGLILRVDVEPGQEVTAGQGVAIMEAMKMENELRSDASGRVAHIHVEPGQAVEKGMVLIEFESREVAAG